MQSNTADRVNYLDSLRSFLIILVVLTHSAQVYNTDQTWLIYSDKNSVVMSYLVELLSLVHMPAFFIISGYFVVLSFRHSHNKNFLSKRISRLVIPLITIALTLNVVQAYILVELGWKNYSISTYISNGDWIQHLWFLINLIVYTIISYIFVRYFKKFIKRILSYLIDKIKDFSIYVTLMFLPILSIVILIFDKLIPPHILGINMYQIIGYMPFFFFGILLMLSKELLKKFSNISIPISIIAIVISFIIIKNIEDLTSLEYKLLYYYFKLLATWLFASTSFTLFNKYMNNKSHFIYNISDSSYSIYLIHHVLVVIIGIVLIYFNIGYVVGLPILFISAVTLSYFIHRKIIRKISILQLLFNGQRSKKYLDDK